ncbi:hypothetical protein [Amycolatopsis sp. NPDC001319]|uniref:hypothetical protein n=1 Tax=unclassified Amycolatopsis TaxID=2618356 RepID=UPI00368A3D46
MTRVDAITFATAVVRAAEDTFHGLRCGRLRPHEAKDVLAVVTEAEYALAELRDHALDDLLHGTGLVDDPVAPELQVDGDDGSDQETEVPVSQPTPALARSATTAETPTEPAEQDQNPHMPASTPEHEFADALGALFPHALHTIARSDAYGALKHKVLRRCGETGETPADVLAEISEDDRAFAPRANDPAAFLASRVDS